MMIKSESPDKFRKAKRESKYIDFKEGFDINQSHDWCEIIKDIVAMANSGGGSILIGLKNDGTPSGWDTTQMLNIDSAKITDKIAKYTGEQFANFDISEIEKNGYRFVLMQVKAVSIPMVFIQPGTYDIGGGKQKTAFGKGTIYFRHGAKSEPGGSEDLKECINREIERIRKSWLGNIRKVVSAPTGYQVSVLPPEVIESELPRATPIRIVDDPTAPAYRKIDPDKTHPYRQKEVVQFVNQKLNGRKKITSYDIQCVRKVHKIDTKHNFFYKSKFASPQYSETFVGWLIEQYEQDQLFYEKAREEYKKYMGWRKK
jgi:hypothetical protein